MGSYNSGSTPSMLLSYRVDGGAWAELNEQRNDGTALYNPFDYLIVLKALSPGRHTVDFGFRRTYVTLGSPNVEVFSPATAIVWLGKAYS